jgi:hypothetical protein
VTCLSIGVPVRISRYYFLSFCSASIFQLHKWTSFVGAAIGFLFADYQMAAAKIIEKYSGRSSKE